MKVEELAAVPSTAAELQSKYDALFEAAGVH